MADIHPVFHVSQLRRCLRVPERERVPEEEIALQTDLRYQEVPVKILDTVTKRTRNSEVRICRVQWSRHGVEEATWEREDALKKEFPHLFRSQPNLEDEIHFKWGRFVTPAFLSYLNYFTNPSLKNLLNLFHRLSSRSPPPDFPAVPTSRSLFLFFRRAAPLLLFPSPSCSVSRKKKGRLVHDPLHFSSLCSPQPPFHATLCSESIPNSTTHQILSPSPKIHIQQI
jgi:hypothetical protein